jgi:ABC-2 type transport system permease protein
MTNKVFIVLKHEFLLKVKSKGYLILTLLAPLILASTVIIPILVSGVNKDEVKNIYVIDESGKLGTHFTTADTAMDEGKKSRYRFNVLSLEGTTTEKLSDSVRKMIVAKQVDGVLIVPAGVISDYKAKAALKLRNTSDFSLQTKVSNIYENAVREERLKAKGIEPAVVAEAAEKADLDVVKVSAESDAKDSGVSFIGGYVTGMLLYISLLIYGSLLMQSVIEEKSSRIIEILASSITPKELLLGKILGVGLAGMLQVTVWAILLAVVSFGALPMIAGAVGGLGALSPINFIYFVLYFVGGFLIFSTLYATAGSTVEQPSDAQQIAMPITILVIIPIVLLTSVIESPSSTSSIVLSLIPFFSPILMIGRIFSETPPLWQILLSFVIMSTTFWLILTFAAKIYRVGILMYGKKYTLKEVLKWVRYS